jgi:hypothetical protein
VRNLWQNNLIQRWKVLILNMKQNQSDIAELSGQSISTQQGQSMPNKQGQSIPSISGQRMPYGILQAMLHQQTLLLKTVQALQQKQ